MYYYWVDVDCFYQYYVVGEVGFQFFVFYGVVVVFDYQCFVDEVVNVGQGFGKDFGNLGGVIVIQGYGEF